MTFPRDTDPCAGMTHFFHGGICIICKTKLACCANCRSSYSGRTPGFIACGHGVDDGALRDEDASKNPIWAVRKYSFDGMRAMMQGKPVEGSDCDQLSPDDGRDCAMFAPKEGL